MKRTWISPLMLVAVLVALLLGSLACSDLVGSDENDAVFNEVVGTADFSLDSPLTGRALVVEDSNLCFTTQRCVGWCEWEDRDTCPSTWCVKMPPDDSPPPPPGAVARLASAAPGTVCVSIQDGDDGPPYGGGPGGPPPPSGNQ